MKNVYTGRTFGFIHEYVGTTHKSTKVPFQHLTQAPYKYKKGPFQCFKPQDMPANQKSVYFEESQGLVWEHHKCLQTALFRTLPKHRTNIRTSHFSASSHRPVRSITNQFVSTDHRSVCSDESQTIHQPSGPNNRRPRWPVKSV